jgi:hypothetical protein
MPSDPLFIGVSAGKKNFKIFCFDSVCKKKSARQKAKSKVKNRGEKCTLLGYKETKKQQYGAPDKRPFY